MWSDALVQRCTVHKHRNLLAHAPERLHEEISADYNDMIYAGTPKEIETRRKSFIRKWRLKCRAVADSLEEAGDRLFSFSRLPDSQWRSARTTNVIERLHEEFKRRIKTQTVLPSAETAAMLFWALLACGQITMRKVDGWQHLPRNRPVNALTLLHDAIPSSRWRCRYTNFHQLCGTTRQSGQALFQVIAEGSAICAAGDRDRQAEKLRRRPASSLPWVEHRQSRYLNTRAREAPKVIF